MKKTLPLLIIALILGYFFVTDHVSNPSETKHVLEFWVVSDLPQVFKPIVEAFENKNPEFHISIKQFPDFVQYQDMLKRSFSKKRGPDIFLFSDTTAESYFSSINPTTLELAKDFLSGAGDVVTKNRLLYGVPLSAEPLSILYHKRYYPRGIPQSWIEFAENTKGISIAGMAMGRLDNLRYGKDILQALTLQVGNTKAQEFFARFGNPKDKYFNWNENLNKNYPDQELDSFVRGKVAAIAGYPSDLMLLKKKIRERKAEGLSAPDEMDVGMAGFPQLDPAHPKTASQFVFVTVSLFSEYPTEAWDFVKSLTNEQNALYYQKITGKTSGRLFQ